MTEDKSTGLDLRGVAKPHCTPTWAAARRCGNTAATRVQRPTPSPSRGRGRLWRRRERMALLLPAGSKLVVAEGAHWTVKGGQIYDGIYSQGRPVPAGKGKRFPGYRRRGVYRHRYTRERAFMWSAALTAKVEETGSLIATGGTIWGKWRWRLWNLVPFALPYQRRTVKASGGKTGGVFQFGDSVYFRRECFHHLRHGPPALHGEYWNYRV